MPQWRHIPRVSFKCYCLQLAGKCTKLKVKHNTKHIQSYPSFDWQAAYFTPTVLEDFFRFCHFFQAKKIMLLSLIEPHTKFEITFMSLTKTIMCTKIMRKYIWRLNIFVVYFFQTWLIWYVDYFREYGILSIIITILFLRIWLTHCMITGLNLHKI